MNETYGLLTLTRDELEFLRWLVIGEIKHLDDHVEDCPGDRYFVDTVISVADRINREIREVERREKEKAANETRSAEEMHPAFAAEPKKESQFQL